MMDRMQAAFKYADDPEYFRGFDPAELAAEEFERSELLAFTMLSTVLALVDEEVEGLREAYPDDKEVCYVLDCMEREGAWYTLVHKMDVGGYLGHQSTMAGYAHALKAADVLLSDLSEEGEG